MLHREDYLKIIKQFRLMDDDFMSKVFDNNIEATQLLLNIVLERTDVIVKSVTAQREFKTVLGHSVKFDVYAEDINGKPYDIEIQRSDSGAVPQRARYNSSVLDTHLLEKGRDYTALRETYIIFITENDVLRKGLPLYHIERKIEETDELFNDGSHIIFVNGQYNNKDSDIGKLMHDFRCQNADDMNYPVLAEKVRYFKESEGGTVNMCRLMEELASKVAAEAAAEATAEATAKTVEMIRKMLAKNYPIEDIAECTGLSVEDIKELASSK